ncbi:efflux RND transporter periplasmic adaptor subunit [Bradyrhizobium liaoningense]|uniref:efflux RND transporter periplasmic adaptor subunit n=1 Tax=Bradyrhizobium liaoningense TaxID=43992 RepID=UPI001BA790DA|nr:efflux RND transporter periplasmic adaptor subunit [Bradyrhizobium liaoningense]MBR1167503.1 efflux RND transporter periplasmic adaptor subunit [Bradyrhizobium liaoningense]
MKINRLSVATVLVATSATLAALLAGTGALSGDKDAGMKAAPAAQVDVAAVQVKHIQHWDEFNGRISAVESIEIRPRVSGFVTRVAYKEGSEVRRGDLLFAIDQRPYQAALDSAMAQLERARATALLAKARDERAQKLLPSSALSQDEADARRAAYAQSEADVLNAEAAVELAQLNLEFTEVKAPIEGRVGRALLTSGNLVVADQSLLTTMVSQDPVYVDFDPDEQSYLRYSAEARRNPGPMAVRVALADEEDFAHRGMVDFQDNRVDPATGSIRMRAKLRNGERIFTPGLYARVQVASAKKVEAILVDDKAVLTDQDRKYVYVLGPNNTAQRKDVQIGRKSDGLRVVAAGLTPGDKVIVGGLQRIYNPGAPVQPSEVSMLAAVN